MAAARRRLNALSGQRGGMKAGAATPLWVPADPDAGAWAEILSISPTIIHSFPTQAFPLGAASAVGPALADRPVHFLLMPAWSLEVPGASAFLDRVARSYLADHPRHTLTFLNSTPRETEFMAAAGHRSITLNHNCLMDDAVFRPLPMVQPIYDAVYNARLSPQKRPELAARIRKLALIYFYNPDEGSPLDFHATHARYSALMPHAHFLNRLTPDGCEWIPSTDVAVVLARARVGLCLSPVEGAMRASIEYLFAGLSVVSTPSLGGRDYVRAKTLARVTADRDRYIRLVQDYIDRGGGTEDFTARFWNCTRGKTIMHWRSMSEFTATVRERVRGAAGPA